MPVIPRQSHLPHPPTLSRGLKAFPSTFPPICPHGHTCLLPSSIRYLWALKRKEGHSIDSDFFCACCFHLRPLAILALIPRLSYHLGQISGGKDDTEAESMLPQSGVSCSRPDLRLRQPVKEIQFFQNTFPKTTKFKKRAQGQVCLSGQWVACETVSQSVENLQWLWPVLGIDWVHFGMTDLARGQKLGWVLVEIKSWLILNACLAVVFQTWLHGHVWPALYRLCKPLVVRAVICHRSKTFWRGQKW